MCGNRCVCTTGVYVCVTGGVCVRHQCDCVTGVYMCVTGVCVCMTSVSV